MGTKKTGEQIYEVRYTGNLTNAENVFMHYGYTNWADVSEKKMRKLKTCCKIEVKLPTESELNFCFRDDNGNWDNNFGGNYFFVSGSKENYEFVEIIEKEAKATTKTSNKTKAATSTSKTKSVAKAKPKTKSTTKKEK